MRSSSILLFHTPSTTEKIRKDEDSVARKVGGSQYLHTITMLTRAYNDKSAIFLKNKSKPKRSFLHGTDIIATATQILLTSEEMIPPKTITTTFFSAKTILNAMPI